MRGTVDSGWVVRRSEIGRHLKSRGGVLVVAAGFSWRGITPRFDFYGFSIMAMFSVAAQRSYQDLMDQSWKLYMYHVVIC